jgi:hypothetical protein
MKLQISKNKNQIIFNDQFSILNQIKLVLNFEFFNWCLFVFWNFLFVALNVINNSVIKQFLFE